jgi:hypothetical protein
VPVTCVTQFAAPYTGGYETTLPAGTVVVVSHDETDGATAIGCQPEELRRLEKRLVRRRDRMRFWVYRGYHVIIPLAAFGTALQRVE